MKVSIFINRNPTQFIQRHLFKKIDSDERKFFQHKRGS